MSVVGGKGADELVNDEDDDEEEDEDDDSCTSTGLDDKCCPLAPATVAVATISHDETSVTKSARRNPT